MEQAYRNRFNTVVQNVLNGAVNVGLVEGLQHLALEVQSLANFQTKLTFDQGRGLLVFKVIQPGDAVAAKLQDVPEPLRGDQCGLGALLLDDSVGGHGESMANFRHHLGGGSQFLNAVFDACQDSLAVIVGGAGDLSRQHLSVVAQEHDVGERAANIYANAESLHAVTR